MMLFIALMTYCKHTATILQGAYEDKVAYNRKRKDHSIEEAIERKWEEILIMGKRSEFERIPKDKYFTFDPKAGEAIKPFLKDNTRYVEPFAGDGDLIKQLKDLGHICTLFGDIETNNPKIPIADAFTLTKEYVLDFWCRTEIITNPPWTRSILHKMLDYFVPMGLPVWIILDANWLFTKQSKSV